MICTAALSVTGISLYFAAPGAHYVAKSYGIQPRKIRPLIACTKTAIVVLGATALKAAGIFDDTLNSIFFSGGATGVLTLASLFFAYEPPVHEQAKS